MPTMTPESAACERLNGLLVELNRSLLQYACEAWPWSSAADGAAFRAAVHQLGGDQQRSVAALAELLDHEGHPVDFGVYPDEYTSLHYLSWRYLLQQLIAGQQSLISDCRTAGAALTAESPAAELLAAIARREEAALVQLQALPVH